MADFVHLHCHTEYSLLDGAIRLKDLCQRALEYEMKACAITDHGNMFAAANFSKLCKGTGLKPIYGCEVYTCQDHKDREDKTRYHLVLLAQNKTGYHNLVKLVSHGWLDGFYYKPRVDFGILRKYQEGLICLSACLAGQIPRAINAGNQDLAYSLACDYAEVFRDRFYLELQVNGLKEQNVANAGLLELAKKTGLPMVATNDCHYLNADDYEAHEVLLCIQTGKTMQDKDRMRFETRDLYFKSPGQMEKDFAAFPPELLTNTVRIAESCDVDLELGKHHFFPIYQLPEGASQESEFRRLAEEGLEQRLANHPDRDRIDCDAYRARLAHEIEVILQKGYPGYFLIVQEFINWAKNHHIPVGPGRGSAAGSLVAWALRITNLDPIPYNLLFERFLNPERMSMPDIDVDFCERRRSLVIEHMVDTYGADSVAQITTFGTMKAKGVIKDVARALGIEYARAEQIAKLIPDDLKMTLDKALEQEAELRKLYDTDPTITNLFDTARRLEGLARHASTHAAGLVVSDQPMEEYLPLYTGKRGEIVTQFDGPMTEAAGLVKFDFLGLKTMTLIDDTLENIRLQGQTPPDLDNLALTDQETFELYARGDMDGVFQMESSGMRQYLRQLRPSCFEDIIAMCALYRPGPLGSGMVDEFIQRKHGTVKVTYPHPLLENCLRDTYGVIVYQEQVMQIAQVVAKYSLGGADELRRAMGKKKKEVMDAERPKFLDGAKGNDFPLDIANSVFDLMAKFAEYGFNKSHSAAYALVSYYTAYLKVHHKVEFMAALLTSEMENQGKLLKYIAACKDLGIDVVAPDVNVSQQNFAASRGKIVFGLGGIKGVGGEAIKSIIEERNGKKGAFISLYDFCCRVNMRKVNKRVLEAMIKSGAFDCLGATRASLLASADAVIDRAQKKARQKESGQGSLLAMTPKKKEKQLTGVGISCDTDKMPEMDDELKMLGEKESLGFYLTHHPLMPYTQHVRRLNFQTIEKVADLPTGIDYKIAVLVTAVKELTVKSSGDKMARVNVEDLTGHAEITVFPRTYAQVRELLRPDAVLCMTVRPEQDKRKQQGAPVPENPDDDEAQAEAVKTVNLLCQGVEPLEAACMNPNMPFHIRVPADKLGEDDIRSLRELLLNHKGGATVRLVITLDNIETIMEIDPELSVAPSLELDKAIAKWAA